MRDWERFWAKNFESFHVQLIFLDVKCQQFLECVFFLLVNCLSGCFVRIAALSVENRCHIMPARGTGNFDIILISSGNRHKFTSMFNCASLVHPCTSVARCQTKFQVPLTALIRHLYFDEPCSYSGKHWKDCFYDQKKNTHFRTVVFHHLKINVHEIPQNSFTPNILPLSQLPAIFIEYLYSLRKSTYSLPAHFLHSGKCAAGLFQICRPGSFPPSGCGHGILWSACRQLA